MRWMIGLPMAAAVLAAGTANAQSLRPGTPSLLRWTLEQQAVRRALSLPQCRSDGGERALAIRRDVAFWP